ncbi:unnamed protein product [Gordionus sp. m RMFG-2023]
MREAYNFLFVEMIHKVIISRSWLPYSERSRCEHEIEIPVLTLDQLKELNRGSLISEIRKIKKKNIKKFNVKKNKPFELVSFDPNNNDLKMDACVARRDVFGSVVQGNSTWQGEIEFEINMNKNDKKTKGIIDKKDKTKKGKKNGKKNGPKGKNNNGN